MTDSSSVRPLPDDIEKLLEESDDVGFDNPHANEMKDRLAALVEAHRDEFDGYLTGFASTVSLAEARADRKPKSMVGRIGPRPL